MGTIIKIWLVFFAVIIVGGVSIFGYLILDSMGESYRIQQEKLDKTREFQKDWTYADALNYMDCRPSSPTKNPDGIWVCMGL